MYFETDSVGMISKAQYGFQLVAVFVAEKWYNVRCACAKNRDHSKDKIA